MPVFLSDNNPINITFIYFINPSSHGHVGAHTNTYLAVNKWFLTHITTTNVSWQRQQQIYDKSEPVGLQVINHELEHEVLRRHRQHEQDDGRKRQQRL